MKAFQQQIPRQLIISEAPTPTARPTARPGPPLSKGSHSRGAGLGGQQQTPGERGLPALGWVGEDPLTGTALQLSGPQGTVGEHRLS